MKNAEGTELYINGKHVGRVAAATLGDGKLQIRTGEASGNKLFDTCFKLVVGEEGGFSLDPRDPGNWTGGIVNGVGRGALNGTKYGISAKSYPKLDIRNLTLTDAEAIYKENYWDRCQCDKLPPGLALLVFDTAVNMGVGAANELLKETKDLDQYATLRLRRYQAMSNYAIYGRGWTNRVTRIL